MKRRRFSDERIIGILKEQEPGAVTADICRRHGISEATLYKWKAKFGGLEVTEATPFAITSAIKAEDLPSEWIHSGGHVTMASLRGCSGH
jgi:putative transposase